MGFFRGKNGEIIGSDRLTDRQGLLNLITSFKNMTMFLKKLHRKAVLENTHHSEMNIVIMVTLENSHPVSDFWYLSIPCTR